MPYDGFTTIEIFDVTGRLISKLLDEYKQAGNYEMKFNAKQFASGVFYYRITSGNFVQVKKMMLIK